MTEEMGMTNVTMIKKGDIITGTVTKIEEKQALIDLGYRYDGILPIGEISNTLIENISDVLNKGDKIDVLVLLIDEDDEKLIVSKKIIDAQRAWEELYKNYEANKVFEVKIADVVKGGLVVDLGVRAFIPASLVEIGFVEDLSDYKGKTMDVKIIELEKEKNKVILSHKNVLEDAEGKRKEELFKKLKIGEIIEGEVKRIAEFGVFVDVGGADGLVHVSEISWERTEKPSDIYKIGDKVKVRILSFDVNEKRISLSIKETLPNPWEKDIKKFEIGNIYTGIVKRLVNFGAFVELSPSIEGLVHISQVSTEHINSPSEVLKIGQNVKVKILDIKMESKKISLSIREAEEKEQYDEITKGFLENKGLNITLGDVFGDRLNKLK